MEDFHYSIKELAEILNIHEHQIIDILDHFATWGLITKNRNNSIIKYKLSDNKISHIFRKLEFEMATHQMDEISNTL